MPDAGPPLHWHEERALWHLELLGCYEPGDAVAPYVPPPAPRDEGWDDEDDEGLCVDCDDIPF